MEPKQCERQEMQEFRNSLRVYARFKNYYPDVFETTTNNDDLVYLKHYVDDQSYALTLEDYKKTANKNEKLKMIYDMHERNFQNFVLHNTSKFSPAQFKPARDDWSTTYVKRTRNFAVASRDDLTWDGKLINDDKEKEQKNKEMNEYHFSAKLYDWYHPDALSKLDEILTGGNKNPKISVVIKDTLKVVEECHNIEKEKNIGWLNFANAHNVGGAYNRSHGSQEENTATHCTAIVTLTLHADPMAVENGNNKAIKDWINQPQEGYNGQYPIKYRNGHHIPPGGAYICKTKLLNTEGAFFDSYMIANASADFREQTSYRPEAEMQDMKNNQENYRKRILLDLESICLTAIYHKIDVLVLGATGCGAFRHNPKIEASLWNETLVKYGNYFEQIIFAILDLPGSKNVIAFQNQFRSSL